MMRQPFSALVALLCFLVVVVIAASPAVAQQPTLGDAQADFSAGDYRSSLQKISRVLSGPTARPGSPQRYDALMLRGECMLQLKLVTNAADSFDSAALSVKGEGDVKKFAAARALELLVRASPGGVYKSARGGSDADAGPINILPPDSRAKAMNALLQDRLVDLKPRIEQAIKGTSLVPMQKLIPDMRDAYSIELAATGDTAQTLPLARSVGSRARELIIAELDRVSGRITELRDLANEPTFSSEGRNEGTIGYRGLTSPERGELKSLAETLVKIELVAQEGRRINRRLGETGAVWDVILADVADQKQHAQAAYDRRY